MEEVQRLIKENLQDPNAFFVFPTDISAVQWAERALEFDGSGAIALERFTAWDRFKTESIRSVQQDKDSISPALRKLFARSLLEQNKTDSFFTSLINPEYSSTSASFTDWITSLLPQLASWKEKFLLSNEGDSQQASLFGQADSEDDDLLRLEAEYRNFLDTNGLFDPAWEKPPFYDEGKTFYIVYPEILQDFLEYKDILSNTEHIRFIHVPPLAQQSSALYYSNCRSELHTTALFISSICKPIAEGGTGVQWTDIAISVPDIKTLEPYLLREFSLYNIPVQLRSGKKLGEYPAGRLFSLIRSCYTEKFSFDSVRNLLLDAIFPWKDPIAADQLITFGVKHNCLYSYDDLDIWNEAFKKSSGEERAKNLYTSLKKHLTALCEADNFEHIQIHYFLFWNTFFDTTKFTAQADLIISRCIVELSSLIDLEKRYPKATVCADPFSFFIEQLNSKDYLAQSDLRGVNIFPYKLASSAPFKQHIVLDASQSSLTILHQSLNFLTETKRKALSLIDTNASEDFIALYTMHSTECVRFTCSAKTFSGYAIPHNSLIDIEVLSEDLPPALHDAFCTEIALFRQNETIALPYLHSVQKEGFFNWIPKIGMKKIDDVQDIAPINPTNTQNAPYQNPRTITELRHCIDAYVRDTETGKIRISPSSLNIFYTCPVQWLYSRVLKIENYSLEASILDDVQLGIFYHEIIRRLLEYIKKTDNLLYLKDGLLPPERSSLIAEYTHDVLVGLPDSCSLKKDLSPLTIEMFRMHEKIYVQKLTGFFTEFSAWFAGSSILGIEKDLRSNASDWELQGKIDCILHFTGNEDCDEGVFIVDFKTARTPTNALCVKTQNHSLQDFQLPSYIRLYENTYCKEKPEVQGASFFSIHGKKPSCIVGVLKSSLTHKKMPYLKKDRLPRTGENELGISFEPTMDALDSAIDGFLTAIKDKDLSIFTCAGQWGQFPDGSKVAYDTCNACHYKNLCRTTYTISGDPL